MLRIFASFCLLLSLACCPVLSAGEPAPTDLPLVFEDDFENGAGNWDNFKLYGLKVEKPKESQ